MPRYRDEDEYRETRGVHRRRFERKGSSTPIIVGCVIGVAVIVVFIFLAMSGKKDPEEDNNLIRAATEQMLLACLTKDRDKIFENVFPTGAYGWLNKRHNDQNRRRYRFWNDQPTPEEVEKAKQFRISEDERMYKELVALPGRLALIDSAMVKDVVMRAQPRVVLSEATLVLNNGGGQAKIVLGPGEKAKWIVQYWEIIRPAAGSR